MITTRTPLRVSFVGGGTDLPSFYRASSGSVISTTIPYYVNISIQKISDKNIYRIFCKDFQETEYLHEILHPIIRESLRFLNFTQPIEIYSYSDIPYGTGLGSSSAFTVGILHALHAYRRENISWQQLSNEAFKIEAEILNQPIGRQDQSIAAIGGLQHLVFNTDDSVEAKNLLYNSKTLTQIEKNLMLFYTGKQRSAGAILSNISCADQKQRKCLAQIQELCSDFSKVISAGKQLHTLGEILDAAWQLKRKLCDGISNSYIDELYSRAKAKGAIGGKLLGAGGGGFMLLYVDKKFQNFVRQEFKMLQELVFKFEPRGSSVLFNTSLLS